MTCPICSHSADPAARAANVCVCPNCGASYVVDIDGSMRRATNMDVAALTAHYLATLQQVRARIARPERRQ